MKAVFQKKIDTQLYDIIEQWCRDRSRNAKMVVKRNTISGDSRDNRTDKDCCWGALSRFGCWRAHS